MVQASKPCFVCQLFEQLLLQSLQMAIAAAGRGLGAGVGVLAAFGPVFDCMLWCWRAAAGLTV
jgi:hypothetical protein